MARLTARDWQSLDARRIFPRLFSKLGSACAPDSLQLWFQGRGRVAKCASSRRTFDICRNELKRDRPARYLDLARTCCTRVNNQTSAVPIERGDPLWASPDKYCEPWSPNSLCLSFPSIHLDILPIFCSSSALLRPLQICVHSDDFAETTLVSTTFTTAFALAPLLYRASPVDPILRPTSVSISEGEFERFTNATSTSNETRAPSPLPPPSTFGHSLSRPSSTSTQTSHAAAYQQPQPEYHTRGASLSQPQNKYNLSLPGLSALANAASASPSQQRSFSSNAIMNFGAAPTPGIAGNTPPVCQNCQTSTTPLWRRDESGSVLCNACGLFLKLHGRPRPISLKTDVIKSRNRVKSANQGPRHKNGLPASQSVPQHQPDYMTPNSHQQNRRVSQMMSTGGSERSASPLSRVNTPSIGLSHDPNIAPPHIFDSITLNDGHFQGGLPPLNQPSPGSSVNGDRHLEPPVTYEQLLNHNNTLRTKVNELQLINMMISESEATLRRERDSANQTVEELRSRIKQLEGQDSLKHPNKKMRMSDVTNE